MKFCPECGSLLNPEDKICPCCKYDVVNMKKTEESNSVFEKLYRKRNNGRTRFR